MVGQFRHYNRNRDVNEPSPFPLADQTTFDEAYTDIYVDQRFSEKPLTKPMNPRRTNGHRGVMIYPRNY